MWFPSLCQEDPLEEGTATHSNILAWEIPQMEEPGGLQSTQSDMTQQLNHTLEKEMVTHSSVLAWKIPWTDEPGSLQSMGLQRVGSNLVTKQQQNDLTVLLTLGSLPQPEHQRNGKGGRDEDEDEYRENS